MHVCCITYLNEATLYYTHTALMCRFSGCETSRVSILYWTVTCAHTAKRSRKERKKMQSHTFKHENDMCDFLFRFLDRLNEYDLICESASFLVNMRAHSCTCIFSRCCFKCARCMCTTARVWQKTNVTVYNSNNSKWT